MPLLMRQSRDHTSGSDVTTTGDRRQETGQQRARCNDSGSDLRGYRRAIDGSKAFPTKANPRQSHLLTPFSGHFEHWFQDMCRMSNGSPQDGPHPDPLSRIAILAEARKTWALQDRRLSRSVD